MVKVSEVGGLSGLEDICLGVGDASIGLDVVGLAVGYTTTGLETVGLEEETGVSETEDVGEIEGVGDRLQPTRTSPISQPVSNHRAFTFPLNSPLSLRYQNLELRVLVGKADAVRVW